MAYYNYFSFNTLINPFGYLDIAGFYLRYYSFIDAIVYLILFLSLTQIVFIKIYAKNDQNKKEAKMIAVAVSLALTVSMVVMESYTSFYLGQLGPLALIIFLLVLAVLLFNLKQGFFTCNN